MTNPVTKLLDLPDKALCRVLQEVIGIGVDGKLTPNEEQKRMVVTLARTSRRMRQSTAKAIRSIELSEDSTVWPSLKVLGPHAWDGLQVLNCSVKRTGFLGFLKWLLPAVGVRELRIQVTGEPYGQERLGSLERLLLGRLFTQIGIGVEVLHVSGIDCNSVLFSALFQCTNLRDLRVEAYGEVSASLLNVLVLICVVNRQNLQRVRFPAEEWKASMDQVPDGRQLANACFITWGTLFGSYRAGLKESAVNLPSDETELMTTFQRISLRMDELEERMQSALGDLKVVAEDLPSCDVPERLLYRFMTQLESVNDGVKC